MCNLCRLTEGPTAIRTRWKSVAAALALSALAVTTAPSSAQDAGNGYGAPPYADNGPPNAPNAECNPANYNPGQAMPTECLTQAYCDQYGCPDDFYDMPIWYGPVFYDNVWFGGPVYYRDWHGRRQYWIHGGWRYDAWQGPRPSWWNAGHYHTGAALGRNFHQNHGAGSATTSVRVWRGTEASTYHDSGGRYYRSGFAGRETVPLANVARGAGQLNTANLRAIGGGSVQTQHGLEQRAPQYHYSGSHNSVGAVDHSFRSSESGGHHGGGH